MNDEERRKLAVKTAQDAGFESAAYLGTQDGTHIYAGVAKEGQPTGLPLFIEIRGSAATTEYGFKYMHLMKE